MTSSTMTTPVILSPSGRWLATSSSDTSNRVSIRDSNSGRLQCTIRCPTAANKMVFLTDSIVVTAVPTVSYLDVTRGVAVTTTKSKKSKIQQHAAVADVASAGDEELLYVLEAKHHDETADTSSSAKKWIVYEYNAEQQLLRKIKVGKVAGDTATSTNDIQLFATADHLLVGSNVTQTWRVVDRATGSKVCKLVGTVRHAAGRIAVGSTTAAANATVWNLATGTVVGTLSGVIDTATLHVVCSRMGKEDECYHVLSGNQQVFRFQIRTNNGDGAAELTSTLVCTLPEPTSRKDSIHYVLHHDELPRAVRFSDAMECTATVVDTAADPVVLEWSSAANKRKAIEDDDTSLKRKQESVILGPGQAGNEAKTLTEATTASKRSCVGTEESDSEDEDEDGPTIAERLAHLQQTLEAEEEVDSAMSEDDDDEDIQMTTESLYQLLHQALQSADKQQLEKALEVRDADTVAQSCRELDSESVAALLVALTHRLATKPTRADHLSVWLTAILRNNPHVSVEHLLPLQNLLQERLEIFPMLLELEGRLDQLAGT